MSLSNLLIAALATWYIAHCISAEKGAFSVFETLRLWLPLGGLTSCVYCLSVWIAAAVVMLYYLVPVLYPLVYPFAIAGLALMLRSYTGAGVYE